MNVRDAVRHAAAHGRSRRRARIPLVVYGGVVCLAGTTVLEQPVPDDFAWSAGRGDRITDAHQMLAEGGPPLLGSGSDRARLSPPVGSPNPEYPGQYYAAGAGDDQGILPYAPLLGQYLGGRRPARADYVALRRCSRRSSSSIRSSSMRCAHLSSRRSSRRSCALASSRD